jgi:hypothetical protein
MLRPYKRWTGFETGYLGAHSRHFGSAGWKAPGGGQPGFT